MATCRRKPWKLKAKLWTRTNSPDGRRDGGEISPVEERAGQRQARPGRPLPLPIGEDHGDRGQEKEPVGLVFRHDREHSRCGEEHIVSRAMGLQDPDVEEKRRGEPEEIRNVQVDRLGVIFQGDDQRGERGGGERRRPVHDLPSRLVDEIDDRRAHQDAEQAPEREKDRVVRELAEVQDMELVEDEERPVEHAQEIVVEGGIPVGPAVRKIPPGARRSRSRA